jgi:putative RNA 2'-phosphotransferase
MNQSELMKRSKYMSLLLRHRPETANITLDSQGRALITELIDGMNNTGVSMDRDTLDTIVETDTKSRYVIDGNYIYAAQGHSIKGLDVNMSRSIPPTELYHGTSTKNIDSIGRDGINSRSRNHVHLSADIDTAMKVGARHGTPVVLTINTKSMYESGHPFYISENGVWLTDLIPPKYIVKYNYS